jgi:hypothetical protein
MYREWWIVGRAYCLFFVLLALALLVGVLISDGQSSGPFAGVVAPLSWFPVAIVGAALLEFLAVSYRLWRWERGDGPFCVTCEGPLGPERSGRTNRGGAFRRCYACGKAVNHRHYESR